MDRRRFASTDLDRVEETIRRIGRNVMIAISPTTETLGGEVWRISCGPAGQDGYGEGHDLASAIADLGVPAGEAA